MLLLTLPPMPEEWSIVITYIPRTRSIIQEQPDVIVVQNIDIDHEDE